MQLRSKRDFPNGKLYLSFEAGPFWEAKFNSGEREGYFATYFPNGRKCLEGKWIAGNPEGLFTCWYINGFKRMESSFCAGTLHGPTLEWDHNGNLVKTGLYHRGAYNSEGLDSVRVTSAGCK